MQTQSHANILIVHSNETNVRLFVAILLETTPNEQNIFYIDFKNHTQFKKKGE